MLNLDRRLITSLSHLNNNMLLALLLSSFITFVQLNCENLFDCKHDSAKSDTEFLPEAPRRWTPWKYWRKINNIAKELIACGENNENFSAPDFIALCEVENDSVMRDLAYRSSLRNAAYDYFITKSPDERGIDVALMYHRYSFAPINSKSISVSAIGGMKPTRDILYVSGKILSGDTLHIFVVHAPSRVGGEKKSRPYRLNVAKHVCNAIDSIKILQPAAHIIIAGDFNDDKDGVTLQQYKKHEMHDATCQAKGKNGAKGSYKYKGKWEMIDHVLLSTPLMPRLHSTAIFDATFLLDEDNRYGGMKPKRSYPSYHFDAEGFSDHLPLVVRLKLE